MKVQKIVFCFIFIMTLIGCDGFNESESEKKMISNNTYILQGRLQELVIDSQDDAETIYVLHTIEGDKIDLLASGVSLESIQNFPLNASLQVEVLDQKLTSLQSKTSRTGGFKVLQISGIQLANAAINERQKNTLSGKANLRVAFVKLKFRDTSFKGSIGETTIDMFKNMIEESTWGNIKVDMSGRDIYEYEINENYRGCDSWTGYGQRAIQYANQQNTQGQYNRVITFLPSQGGCGWIGVTVRSSYTELDSSPIATKSTSAQVVAHEFGHSIGLGHSGLDADKNGKYSGKTDFKQRYADYSCFMSNKTVPMTANPVKLLTLNVLSPETGLRPVAQGDVVLRGLATNPYEHGEPVAYYKNQYVFSLRSRNGSIATSGIDARYLQGVSVHVRFGNGAGNVPSSGFIDVVKPGQVWKAPDGTDLTMQVLSLDPIEAKAIVRFNGDIEDVDNGYEGDCAFFDAKIKSISHSSGRSQMSSSFLTLQAKVQAVGQCEGRLLKAVLTPKDTSIQVPKIVYFDLKNNQDGLYSVSVPYSQYLGVDNYIIQTDLYFKDQYIATEDKTVTVDTCKSGSLLCRVYDECSIPPALDIYMEGNENVEPGDTVSGEAYVINNNPEKCGVREYFLQSSYSSADRYKKEDLILDPRLSELEKEKTHRKRFFLAPGKSVRIPFQYHYTEQNWPIPASLLVSSNDSAWSNTVKIIPDSINQYMAEEHPFKPEPVSEFHITGKNSTCSDHSMEVQASVEKMTLTRGKSSEFSLIVKDPHPSTDYCDRAQVEVAVVNGAGVELTGVKGFVLNPSTEKQLGILVKATDKSKNGSIQFIFSSKGKAKSVFVKIEIQEEKNPIKFDLSDYIKNVLYKTFLNRSPDSEGLAFWIDQTKEHSWTIQQLTVNFMGPALEEDAFIRQTNKEFIENLYVLFLGRASDPDGFNFWLNQIESHSLTRHQVMASFVNSNEFLIRWGSVTL